MQISLLLRKSAERFNQAAASVCIEWSLAIASSGICSPSDRTEFERLIKIKMAAPISEIETALHTITGDNHLHEKLTA